MGAKIHLYPLERFTFGDNDYYDIDYFDGLIYQTAKIKGSTIKAGIIASLPSVDTIYNADGSINSDRVITGTNSNQLLFDAFRQIVFNTNPAPFGVPGFIINSGITGPFLRVNNAVTGVSMLDVSTSGVRINQDYTLPILDGAAGQFIVTDGNGNLSWATPAAGGDMLKSVYDPNNDGVVLTAEKLSVEFINKTGATLTKGTIVYLKSTSASGTHPEALKANATSELTSSKTIGAVFEDTANDAIGRIITSGEVSNLDTTAFPIGTKLWLSTTPGQVTATPPTQPNHTVFIGTVTRSQNTNGRILYSIQNGFELEELHNVLISGTPTNGQVLTFESATQLWKNQNLPSVTITNIYNSNGTLTADRTLNANNFILSLLAIKKWIVEVIAAAGTTAVEFNITPNGTLFQINDVPANKSRLTINSSGNLVLNELLVFPLSDGTTGQVLTTNGSGVLSWQSVTTPSEFIPKISGFNVSRFYTFTNNSTTVFFSGLVTGALSGTQSPLVLTGSTATKLIRTRFTSGTTSGSIAGYRGGGTDIAIGMGWHCVFTFGFADTTFNSAAHNWVGLGASTSFQIGSLTYASSLGNIIGIGNDPTDTTLQIMHNDSTGSAIKTALSSNFPANRTAGTAFTGMICFELFNEVNSSDVKWRVTRIDTGATEQGTITSTDKPSASTFLCPVVSRSNGTSSSIAAIMDVSTIQIFTKF